MPPESTALHQGSARIFARLAPAWREPLAAMAFAAALLVLVTRREWGQMAHQWWEIDTYSHILIVPIIIAWLVTIKRHDLAKITPQAWLPGLGLVAAGFLIWLIGRSSDINLIAHAGAVGALQGLVVAIIGPRASLLLALPIGFGVFLVPFGDEIIPPLQMITAHIAISLTLWSGVSAEIDGINIFTPAGWFIVAEACSGVRFLIAMIALSVLVCFTSFVSWRRRAVFLAACIIVPILANGVRAWGTIYVAQFYGIEFAAGFDHIIYGWIFFAIVVAGLLGAAWPWFENESEDYGWNLEQVDALPILPRLDGAFMPYSSILSLLAIIALVASALEVFVPRVPLS